MLVLCRYMVTSQDDRRLVSLSLQQFVQSVGARTAAPGGGSVSAAVAALVRTNEFVIQSPLTKTRLLLPVYTCTQ